MNDKKQLFSFIGMRQPQLIQPESKQKYFVYDDKKDTSVFLQEVDPEKDLLYNRNILYSKIEVFLENYASTPSLKENYPNLYEFSYWLARNRGVFAKDEFLERVNNTNIDNLDTRIIWDTLYYQLITGKSKYVRETSIIMLIGYHAIINADDKLTIEELYKTAESKVVVDKVFSAIKNTVQKRLDQKEINTYIDKQLQVFKSDYVVKETQAIVAELQKLKDLYDTDYTQAYKTAVAEHTEAFEQLLTDEIKAKQKADQQAELENALAADRPVIEIPYDVEVPKFVFSYPSIFSEQYRENLSDNANNLLNRFAVTENTAFENLIDKIDNEIRNEFDSQLCDVKEKNKVVKINNAVIATSAPYLDALCYNIKIRQIKHEGNSFPIIAMYVNFGNSLLVTNEEHHLIIDDSTHTSTQSNEIEISNDNNRLFNLFPNLNLDIENIAVQLNGSFTFDNGQVFSYSVGVSAKGIAHACGTLSGNDETDPVLANKTLYGIENLGVAEYLRVEQEVCCYLPGEVSHIENIMAKEYKEKSTRNLLRNELTSETTEETEMEETKDTVSTERNQMQTEVSNVIDQQKQQSYGGSLGISGKAWGMNIALNTHTDFSSATATTRANNVATDYAKEVTESVVQRILSRTTKKRTSRIIKEYEENNKHGFDNRKGDKHVSGVYRWIDLMFKNELVNYGKRLIYEFVLPEPSRNLITSLKAEKSKDDNCKVQVIDKPLHPSLLPGGMCISSAKDINNVNYQLLASYYNAEVDTPPEYYKKTGVSFTKSQALDGIGSDKNKAEFKDVRVPEGYKAIRGAIHFDVKADHSESSHLVGYSVGNNSGFSRASDAVKIELTEIGNHTDKVPVSIYFNWIWAGTVAVNITFVRTSELYQQWQNETYNAILKAYQEQMDLYTASAQQACIDETMENEEQNKINPAFNRIVEQRELKRIAIEMMTAPFQNPMAQENYSIDAHGKPVVLQNAQFAHHAEHVKFFEEAFDWKIMSYMFYPYYWASKEQWYNLMNRTDSTDPVFQAFLQSGMAKMSVPVRPGYEDAVLYYMETGDIWSSGDLLLEHDEDYYISISKDLNDIDPTPIDTWTSKVPTSLTMIQKDTLGLDIDGLPCCSLVELPDGKNPINNEAGALLVNDCANDEQPDEQ